VIHKPSLILATKPTGNLHSSQGKEIMELFTGAEPAGTTIVQVTHSDVNAQYGNRVVQLRMGGWYVIETWCKTSLRAPHLAKSPASRSSSADVALASAPTQRSSRRERRAADAAAVQGSVPLVVVWETKATSTHNVVNPANYMDWHDRQTTSAVLRHVMGGPHFTGDEAEGIQGRAVARTSLAVARRHAAARRT